MGTLNSKFMGDAIDLAGLLIVAGLCVVALWKIPGALERRRAPSETNEPKASVSKPDRAS